MSLRDYQKDIYDRIRGELRTHKGVCAVLPCRSGKSYIMREIAEKAAEKGSRVLILAHRRLLLSQHAKLIGNARLESVFTEANHLGEHGKVDLIIIDEAHVSAAPSYRKVCDYYGCRRILFTATASRLDGKPLDLCDSIVNGISADELIERGLIAPYDLYAPKLNVDLSNVSVRAGDYAQEELTATMCDRKVYGDIVGNYRKLADGRQAIAYCAGVRHSVEIRDLFRDNGISAEHMDASTPEDERERIMERFRKGDFRVLCNCNLISEGMTLPECDCCLLLRPTQSETLYVQQACRCLTPREGKRAVIIDFVGNCYAHGLPTAKRVYTLERRKPRNPSREPGVLIRECESCFRVYNGTDRICPYCGHDNGKTRKQMEADEKAELERVTEINRKRARMEVGMARTEDELTEIGRKRGYRNPRYWARSIMEARRNKLKNY